MDNKREELLSNIYNLILNKATRTWERQQLQKARHNLEEGYSLNTTIDELIYQFRPLAWRDNLTADVNDFYDSLTGKKIPITIKSPVCDTHNDEVAIFAGGCFWCMVEPFETYPGVISVTSGYTGGYWKHPTYDQVMSGGTGHVEAVKIHFNPKILTYNDLVSLYWNISDPTDDNGQFQDRGNQYKPVIYTTTEKQKQIAIKSKLNLIKSKKYTNPIVTKILSAQKFWTAETRHQQFYLKQPKRYKNIKHSRNQLKKILQWHNKWTQFTKNALIYFINK